MFDTWSPISSSPLLFSAANQQDSRFLSSACLNGALLKWLAIASMTIDHIGAVFCQSGTPLYLILRIIGRFAFPIFCLLLVEGYIHTKNLKKYFLQLCLFAVLAEIPFNLALHQSVCYPIAQNVLWQLMLGLVTLCGYDSLYRKYGTPIYAFLFVAFMCLIATLLCVDYGFRGILYIITLYLLRKKPLLKSSVLFVLIIYLVYASVSSLLSVYEAKPAFGDIVSIMFMTPSVYAALSVIPIALYNGEKGNAHVPKWFFYAYYPVHLLVLWLISKLIMA